MCMSSVDSEHVISLVALPFKDMYADLKVMYKMYADLRI